MILVDLFCPHCDNREIDVFVDMKELMPFCPICGVEMKRLVGHVNFKLVYDNRKDSCDWQGNSSQYWKRIKEEGGDEPANEKQAKWM